MSEQADNLERVKLNQADIVLAFARDLLASGQSEFHMAALQAHVAGRTASAPASPDRILRQLRRDGLLDYEVIDRASSLYRLRMVVSAGAENDEPLPDRRHQGSLFDRSQEGSAR